MMTADRTASAQSRTGPFCLLFHFLATFLRLRQVNRCSVDATIHVSQLFQAIMPLSFTAEIRQSSGCLKNKACHEIFITCLSVLFLPVPYFSSRIHLCILIFFDSPICTTHRVNHTPRTVSEGSPHRLEILRNSLVLVPLFHGRWDLDRCLLLHLPNE